MQLEKYDDNTRSLIEKILEFHRVDADKTFKYCTQLIDIGNEKNDPVLLGVGNFYIGESSYFSNNLDKFFDYTTQALPFLDKAEEYELVANCYNLFGIWAMNKGNAPIAQDYYMNAMKYCRLYHLSVVWIKVSVNLGMLNNMCGCYEDARVYLEEALNYLNLNPKDDRYHDYALAIYENLGLCLTMLEQYDLVLEIMRHIHEEHWDYITLEDKLLTWCMESLYYDRTKNISERDKCIELVQESLNDSITIMDMFEDYCLYAQMLISAWRNEEFWHLVDTMEKLINSGNLTRMKLRLVDLKLQYYKKHSMAKEFAEFSVNYYELSRQLEEDARTMMASALNLRKNLEVANLERIKVETQNRLLLLRSETDPLTGLFNRYRMDSYADQLFGKCSESQTPIAVEILDVDYFKEYNDNYGHQSGDQCLVRVSEVLKQVSSVHDAFCARYGGDEFVLIYKNVTRDDVFAIAKEIKDGVTALNLEHKYSKAFPFVTVSQGLCQSTPLKKNRMWDFLHAADNYLYKVKSVSRNSFCVGDVKESEDFLMEHQNAEK